MSDARPRQGGEIMTAERYHRPTADLGNHAMIAGAGMGLVGGLVGTVAMDIVLTALLLAIGVPAVIVFTTIGDTAASAFALVSLRLAGGAPLAAAVYCLLGLVLGAVFGVALAGVARVRSCSKRGCIVLGVLYAEIVSQPILALSPLLLGMTAADTVQWFAISAAMHAIWGGVLGAIASYGLQLPPAGSGRVTPNWNSWRRHRTKVKPVARRVTRAVHDFGGRGDDGCVPAAAMLLDLSASPAYQPSRLAHTATCVRSASSKSKAPVASAGWNSSLRSNSTVDDDTARLCTPAPQRRSYFRRFRQTPTMSVC
jgi:hypothetical protein